MTREPTKEEKAATVLAGIGMLWFTLFVALPLLVLIIISMYSCAAGL